MQSTYLLVSHGSRDPRPQLALEKLAQRLRDQMAINLLPSSPTPVVGTATLECAAIPLSQQIQHFSEYTHSLGLNQLEILPLFLLAGVHVKEDIPKQVAIAQKSLGAKITLKIKPYLGSQVSQIAMKLASQMTAVPVEAWVLIAHGSRRVDGNEPVEKLAEKLRAPAAYWSVEPSLETQVKRLVEAGYKKIGILPYFIFSGGITEAIAQSVEQFYHDYSSVEFFLTKPLEAHQILVDLIRDILKSSESSLYH